MSFIYCTEDTHGRWYYQESAGFRERLPGSSSGFSRDKSAAYRFATKEEAWEHCRTRRRGGHWGRGSKWIVITLAPNPDPERPAKPRQGKPKEKP